jgi:hypothetical protein
MKDYDIEEISNHIDFVGGALQNIHDKFLLTNYEIEILKKYHIDYQKCHSLKEVLFQIEDLLNEMDITDDELEGISISISERDYYQNTNK